MSDESDLASPSEGGTEVLTVGTSGWAIDVLANSHDSVVAVDAMGRVLWLNAGAEKAFGYRADSVVGRDVEMLIPGRFAAGHRAHIQEFLAADGSSRPMATRGVLVGQRADGSEFPTAGSISCMATEEGPVMTAILTDLTAHHQTSVRAEKLVRALDGAHVGLLVADHADRVIEANLACTHLVSSWRDIPIVDRPIAAVLGDLDVDWTTLRNDVAERGAWIGDVRHRGAGSAGRHLRLWVASHRDHVTGVSGHVVTLVDTTETMNALESARRNEHLRARSQHLAGLATVELSQTLEVMDWSPELLDVLHIRHRRSPVSYRTFLRAFVPDHRVVVDELIGDVLASGRSRDQLFSVGHEGGDVWHCRLWAETVSRGDADQIVLLSIQDVTAEQERLDAAVRAERQLRAVLNAMTARTVVVDNRGTIQMVNNAWTDHERRCELAAGARAGDDYLDVVRATAGALGGPIISGVQRVLDNVDDRFSVDFKCVGEPECEHWYMLTAEHVDAPEGGVVISHRDITPRKRAEAELAHRAAHDELTGLANRTLIRDHIDQAAVRRADGCLTAVMVVDLDRFKVINDSLGHSAGDVVLTTVARRFREATRPSDMVGRLGGDEFVVVCEQLPDREAACVLADRLLHALHRPVYFEGRALHVRASIGIATSESGSAADETLRHADTAMYASKRRGGHRYALYDEDLGAQALARMDLEHDLRHALSGSELSVACQPLYDLNTGALTGFEALCRWNHPIRGDVPPGEFIPIAEQSDLIIAVGSWVLSEAVHLMSEIDRIDMSRSLRMAVNVSPRQVLAPGFAEDVTDHLARCALEPERLELELTESAVVENIDELIDVLRRLRMVGVRVALDDFGTGTASLSQLSRLPVSTVKIDRSFIENITNHGGGPAIVLTSILAIAAARGLDTVAEGIETKEQLAALRQLGCGLGQGYVLGRPARCADRDSFPPRSLPF